ncbi:thiamine kinase-like enzyme [Neobacillus niacini]|uniref:aminoglycoside phosphotransferase family protein n=1 Tax=Neobacillus niacini TaxID=86668 RepID=UPI002865458B|nr:aminoglycoside phosphotransferase family protein [Neobacillus niacini]MDR7076115.1 thiamine kinase-like enzyme [Neobacillus niacini]
MRVKFKMDETMLAAALNQQYGIHVKDLFFIPWGTSAYSYRVNCVNGECYYLKLFDTTDSKQRNFAERIDFSLAITWKLYHEGVFRDLTYPIKTKDGHFKAVFNQTALILFNFIEGKTLKDTSTSKETIEKTAKLIASLHKATPKIDQNEAKQEQFYIGTQKWLMRSLSVLETKTKFDHPYKKALQELILTNKEKILNYLNLLRSLHASVITIEKERVFCHGDLGTGNIIIDHDEIFLIDWEYAVFAPPEFDLSCFISTDFEFFFRQYEKFLDQKVILHADLIKFYSYRSKLDQLNHLITNILYRNTDESHNGMDLEEITKYSLPELDRLGYLIDDIQSRLKENFI